MVLHGKGSYCVVRDVVGRLIGGVGGVWFNICPLITMVGESGRQMV